MNRSRLGLWSRLKEAVLLVLGGGQLWDEYTLECFGQVDKLDEIVKKIKENYREWEELREHRKPQPRKDNGIRPKN